MSESDTPHTTVALTTEIAAKLQQLADVRGRMVNDVALEAIQHYLDWLEALDIGGRDAVEAWSEYKKTGLHVTADEADGWLAELEDGNDVEPPECHT